MTRRGKSQESQTVAEGADRRRLRYQHRSRKQINADCRKVLQILANYEFISNYKESLSEIYILIVIMLHILVGQFMFDGKGCADRIEPQMAFSCLSERLTA